MLIINIRHYSWLTMIITLKWKIFGTIEADGWGEKKSVSESGEICEWCQRHVDANIFV